MKPNNQSDKDKLITSYEEAKLFYYRNEGSIRDYFENNSKEVRDSYEKFATRENKEKWAAEEFDYLYNQQYFTTSLYSTYRLIEWYNRMSADDRLKKANNILCVLNYISNNYLKYENKNYIWGLIEDTIGIFIPKQFYSALIAELNNLLMCANYDSNSTFHRRILDKYKRLYYSAIGFPSLEDAKKYFLENDGDVRFFTEQAKQKYESLVSPEIQHTWAHPFFNDAINGFMSCEKRDRFFERRRCVRLFEQIIPDKSDVQAMVLMFESSHQKGGDVGLISDILEVLKLPCMMKGDFKSEREKILNIAFKEHQCIRERNIKTPDELSKYSPESLERYIEWEQRNNSLLKQLNQLKNS